MNDISVHLHIYYEDAGLYLLEKLSKIWNGRIYLSLIKNNCANDIFLLKAKGLFGDIKLSLVDNKGTDQYGFFHSFKLNTENTKRILYWHDKHLDKKQWLDNLTDIFCDNNNDKLLQRYTSNMSSCGIVSSSKHRMKTATANQLEEISSTVPFEYRQQIVRNFQCLLWLKELQDLFKSRYNLYSEEDVFPYFTAGTVFLIRRDIVEKVHSIIHENFFENCYREDGDVGHGLERFYFYASRCMGYNNKFI